MNRLADRCLGGAVLSAVCAVLLLSGRISKGFDGAAIGVTPLRAMDPTLIGSNIVVAQAEAGRPFWQVNPSAVGQPESLFTWISAEGSATNFPNALGGESGHANAVGYEFFGSFGVAPGVSHVDNYEADHFYDSVVFTLTPMAAAVVSQSFIFTDPPQTAVDVAYDNYAALRNTLFVSGVGNGGVIYSPATCYNGIGVGALGGASSYGPTPDNGRSKPDIVAPASFTSFSTPQVAGAAALLLQAAGRGDAGPGTASVATNAATIKALLLNGAIKFIYWTNSPAAPLDQRYGAGVLNLYNSYVQLRAGRHSFIEASSHPLQSDHPPGTNAAAIFGVRGWDVSVASSSIMSDGANHYYLELPGAAGDRFTGTVTLVWNRRFNQPLLNNLDLFLFRGADAARSTRLRASLVACSTSVVDNVEHLFLTDVPPGRYDLQVFKHGGLTGRVSNNETYSLAFDFVPARITIERGAGVVTVSWPVSSVGFILQATEQLGNAADWGTVSSAGIVTNAQHSVTEPSAGNKFYRLYWP